MTELQKSPQVDMKGFLLRYETFKGRSGWKKRWAVLCDFCLYLYKEQTSKECFYALLLPNSRVTQSHDSSGQYRSSIKVEEPNQQPVYLSTETPLDFQLWFEALASAAQMRRIQPEQHQQLDVSFGGQLQQQQQFGISSSSQSSRMQEQQQLGEGYSAAGAGGGAGIEVVSRNHQYDYRHDNGDNAEIRLSHPTLQTAEGQYNFRQQQQQQQQYEMQQPSLQQATTVTTTTYERTNTGGDQMRELNESTMSINSRNGIGYAGDNVERSVERVQYNLQYGANIGGTADVVRAEPVSVPAAASGSGSVSGSARTGRYETRTEVHSQQHGQGGRAGSYGIAGMSGGALGASNFSINRRAIETVREDPQMDESEVIVTAPLDEIKRKYPVSGLAKRMSIAASDLLGKSHDELLLLLIQLNREKASLERRRDYYLALLRHQPDMRGADRMQAELREIDNQIELHDPLITFINNIISMGALYSGDDVMFASEYRQHLLQPGELKPVKANVGFLRKQQERDVARQFSSQSASLDTPDGDILAVSSISAASESQEFTITRQQLEAELNELETVYAEHRRRKTNLAAFMSDLGRRAATAAASGAGKSFVSASGSSTTAGSSGAGSYLETDLDTGATIDLAAKFPQRRTAVPRIQQQQQQQQHSQLKSRTMPNSSGARDANGVLLRAGAASSLDRRAVGGSVSDEVFATQHHHQQQHQQPQRVAASGGVGRYEVTTTTSKTTFGQQPQQQQQQQQSSSLTASYQRQNQPQYGVSVVETNRSTGVEGGGGGSGGVNARIPDPDEFLRLRTARLSSTGGGSGSGLPPGQPPPEVYMSQPQLHRMNDVGQRGTGGGGGVGGSGGSHTASMQEKLNLAIGIDMLDSPIQRTAAAPQQKKPSASDALGAGTKKPLISLDSSRYKRNTNYSADLRGDYRNEALDHLGQFVEDMRGLQRGTYHRADN